MSQTTGKRTNTAQSTPSVDELAALEKLEAAQLLAEQCKALDEIGPESDKTIAWREALPSRFPSLSVDLDISLIKCCSLQAGTYR